MISAFSYLETNKDSEKFKEDRKLQDFPRNC